MCDLQRVAQFDRAFSINEVVRVHGKPSIFTRRLGFSLRSPDKILERCSFKVLPGTSIRSLVS